MIKTRILKNNAIDLKVAADALLAGELVSFPTETVYGLGALARNEHAIAQVFAAKERPAFDPLIVHIQIPPDDFLNGLSLPSELKWSRTPVEYLAQLDLIEPQQLSGLAVTRVNRLAQAFWPGPLTLILPRASSVLDLITSGLETVALRMPRHALTQSLLNAIGQPIVGPSANRFGRISPTTANDVMMELEGRIPFILDGGRAQVGVESTVLFIELNGDVRLLRPGGLSREDIEASLEAAVLGREGLPSAAAPGQLANHYAPRKPLLLLPKAIEEMNDLDWDYARRQLMTCEHEYGNFESLGLLGLRGLAADKVKILSRELEKRISVTKILSEHGNLEESAHLLFGSLRVLDLSPADCLISEPCPPTTGLSWAIHDRLTKASRPQD